MWGPPRDAIPAAAQACARDGADVLVRINRDLEDAVADIRAAVIPGVTGLVIPKVHSADHVALLDEVITSVEEDQGLPAGHTSLMLLIETPAALRRVDHLASGSPRVAAMSLGVHDLAAELDVAPDSELLLHAHERLVLAALASGIAPLGVVGAPPMSDLTAYAAAVERARQLGYRGGTAVHPTQVPVLRDGFGPTREEVDLATRMVAAFEQAVREGRGSVRVDGRMVDEPVARRARRTLRAPSAQRRHH
ncbi:aldolase/citrate lyase family protein [Nocardioides sp. cx-169]|uniref:HpcH/HpaI aldolase/citrate lyase family protein n=1 Tax=Nocardioides sp. cx-169 TaxID=2899080 RepID=UPI001E629C1E|nr:aldolase/citrate lyase family protein [Nocardioides sp. cx-169]MCD4534019.1 aldolase/citrate lyase family protein [Nocardioides sp. cx-169]